MLNHTSVNDNKCENFKNKVYSFFFFTKIKFIKNNVIQFILSRKIYPNNLHIFLTDFELVSK